MVGAVGQRANLRLIRPIRVLVVSRDRRFLGLSRFLLTRDGFDVDTTTRPGDLFEVVQRGAVDVVVMDATGALGASARAAAELEALYPDLGVIVVADEPEPYVRALPALPKWAGLEQLADLVRRSYLRLSPA
ncbi:MAG: hypothetical protein ACXWYS_05615 [Gaiellaceae bacterium]